MARKRIEKVKKARWKANIETKLQVRNKRETPLQIDDTSRGAPKPENQKNTWPIAFNFKFSIFFNFSSTDGRIRLPTVGRARFFIWYFLIIQLLTISQFWNSSTVWLLDKLNQYQYLIFSVEFISFQFISIENGGRSMRYIALVDFLQIFRVKIELFHWFFGQFLLTIINATYIRCSFFCSVSYQPIEYNIYRLNSFDEWINSICFDFFELILFQVIF